MYQILILQTLSFSVDSAWKMDIEGSQAVHAFLHFQVGDFLSVGGEIILVWMSFYVFFHDCALWDRMLAGPMV